MPNSSKTLRSKYYTIGEISKLYHFGADSIRYYENKGLIIPERSASGYRLYQDHDIWKMNVIEELRAMDISVDRIKEYLDDESLDSTVKFLTEELKTAEEKVKKMQMYKHRIESALRDINEVKSLELGVVKRKHTKECHAFSLMNDFTSEEEMDLMMMRITDEHGEVFHVMGNNRLVALLNPIENPGHLYRGVLLLSENGDITVPEGDYLSICYSGGWSHGTDSRDYAKKLIEYAEENNIKIDTQFYDRIWADVHVTSVVEDRVSEVIVRIL